MNIQRGDVAGRDVVRQRTRLDSGVTIAATSSNSRGTWPIGAAYELFAEAMRHLLDE